MRVLMVNTGVFPAPTSRGGAENHVYYLSNKLAELGLEIDLVSDLGKSAYFHDAIRTYEINLPELPLFEGGFYGYSTRHILGGLYTFIRTRKLDPAQYDIIHVHGRLAPFLITRARMRRGKPAVVFTVNDDPPSPSVGHTILYDLSYWVISQAALASNLVICTSPNIVSHLTSRGLGPSGLEMVPNGVDSALFKPQQVQEEDYCIFVGALTRRKNVAHLISAMDAVPEMKCVIVGDGHQREELWRLGEKLEDRITFTGLVKQEELIDLYSRASFFVLPSFSDTTCISMLEAMACGKPVCVTRVGDIPNIVREGYNGMLVEPGYLEELKEKMVVLSRDPELRRRMGMNARETIERQYSWDVVARKVVRTYEKTLDSGTDSAQLTG